MNTILLSFSKEWFRYLNQGEMKFEYRRSLPAKETRVYFYVSHPVKVVTGMAHFGPREPLKEWLNQYGSRSKTLRNRILDYMTDCNYAVKIYEYIQTNRIPLRELRENVPGFNPPRMYYFIDNSPLLEYLENNLKPSGKRWKFTFEDVADSDICNILGQDMG